MAENVQLTGLQIPVSMDTANFDRQVQAANKSAERFSRTMQNVAESFGLSREQATINRLATRGASEELVNAAKAAAENVRRLREQAKAQDEAKRIIEATRTPMERFNAEQDKLNRLLQRGVLPIEAHARALDAARQQYGRLDPAILRTTSLKGRFFEVMRGGRTAFSGFARGISGAVRSLMGWQSALLAAAGVGGFGFLIKQQMELLDATGKLADRTGDTTEGLQQLRYAAGLAGVDSAGLDKALEQLVRRVGEAKTGTGEATDALNMLGLSADQMASMAPSEQFRTIAERISGIENASVRATVAYDLFGRQGQALLNTLTQGRAALDAQANEAERLGIVFSRVDAAKVEQANDAVSKLRSLLSGVANQMAVRLAPVITDISERVIAWAAAGDGVKGKLDTLINTGQLIYSKFTSVLDSVINAFDRTRIAVLKTIQSIIDGAAKITDTLAYLPGGMGDSAKSGGDFLRAFSANITDEVNKLEKAINGRKPIMDSFLSYLSMANIKANAYALSFADSMKKLWGGAAEKAAESAARLAEEESKRKRNIESMIQSLQEQAETLGMTRRETDLYRLAKLGANQADLDSIQAIYNEIDARQQRIDAIAKEREEYRNLENDAKRITDQVKTPLERFNDEVARLNKLRDSYLITEETYARAIDKAKESIEGQTRATEKLAAVSGSAIEVNRFLALSPSMTTGPVEAVVANATTPSQQRREAEAKRDADQQQNISRQQLDRLTQIRDANRELLTVLGVG